MTISEPTIYLLVLPGAFLAAFANGAAGLADGLILNAF